MLLIELHKKIIASFDRKPVVEEGDNDDGVYIFDVNCFFDGSAVVTSLSDNCLAVYDAESLAQIRKLKGHSDMINGFDLSKTTPNSIYSVSNDHYVYGWDLRASSEAPAMKIKLADEVTAISVGMNDSLLAAGYGSSISFYDIRGSSCFSDNWNNKKATKLGEYSDIHTDTVTQLKFSTVNPQILASGAEDGLISLFDTSAADGDEAVVSIFNTECPVRRIGFFGVEEDAMYCLSTTETASFWHCTSAQRVGNFPNVREELGMDYLVDCMYDCRSDTLRLLAGDYNGDSKIAIVTPTALQVAEETPKGHSATIRCSKYYTSGSGVERLITSGEDSRVCSWNLKKSNPTAPSIAEKLTNSSNKNKDNKSSFKKKIDQKADRRQKPY
mmetsp:Transcript_25922/g.24763  ORF Transcript_25922/g.24763 Transcript_25922/m.24763 type:complete len:385 (-) Transcript_25922:191-1345(-)